MGKRLLASPQGIEIVGSPYALNGRVFLNQTSPATGGDIAKASLTSIGGTETVGVNNTSTYSNTSSTPRRTRSSSRRPFTYSVVEIFSAWTSRSLTQR